MRIKFESVDKFFETFAEHERFEAIGWPYYVYKGINDYGATDCKCRCIRYPGDQVLVLMKGKQYGYMWPAKDFIGRFTCIVHTEEELKKAWEKRAKKVIAKLEASGLWPELKTEFETVLKNGYENRDKAYAIYEFDTKAMYFGKMWNETEKEQIAEVLANKEKYSVRHQAGYDVSFSYNPKLNKAWYSEEYRGCGNGHYYIAIDATTALYVEDD